jgi:hypothetical protein
MQWLSTAGFIRLSQSGREHYFISERGLSGAGAARDKQPRMAEPAENTIRTLKTCYQTRI